jgi:hypothetical protein
MSTSGIYTLPLTAEEIITQAYYELGAYAAGETPSGTDIDDGVTRLNVMLKTMAGEGAMYRDTTGTVTVTGGTSSVAAPDDCRDISSIRLVVSSTYHRLMTEWNRSEYYSIPNRTATGDPIAYYISKTPTGLTINVWPVPTADVTLELDYGKYVEIVSDPSDNIDIPEEWNECLILSLAVRCASMFGTTRVDPATVQRLDARAGALYQRLLDRDRPNSYILEADC